MDSRNCSMVAHGGLRVGRPRWMRICRRWVYEGVVWSVCQTYLDCSDASQQLKTNKLLSFMSQALKAPWRCKGAYPYPILYVLQDTPTRPSKHSWRSWWGNKDEEKRNVMPRPLSSRRAKDRARYMFLNYTLFQARLAPLKAQPFPTNYLPH